MLKKTILALAGLAVSVPVLADNYGHRGHGYGHGHRVVHQPHYVVHHRPVVVHQPVYYRPAPQPVYVVQRPHYNGAALLFGAVLGAAIVHHAVAR